MKENVIMEKSFEFSLSVIALYKEMIEQKEFILSKQLLRSATSVGANIVEAGAGQSRRDFVAKMSIASKEARETRYWLQLLDRSSLVKVEFKSYLKEIDELIRMLTAIVKTSQNNLKLKA